MKKKWCMILGKLCYTLGIVCALYVGGWLMLIKPIHTIMTAFSNDQLTTTLLIKNIICIAFSTTFGGLVWCVGYFGYNFFKGTEDPDWAAIEAKFEEKKAKALDKIDHKKRNKTEEE